MFNDTMSINEMDDKFLKMHFETNKDHLKIAQLLLDTDLKSYNEKFKQENGIKGEITNENMKLLTNIGSVIIEEKSIRDKKAAENLNNWDDIFG
ncbi:hypothetical protein ACIQ6U_08310 [Lysinibacillus fusiformis]|uniref:hypothetical protein n=1 Tax=Lysinibacillus fusiformis TaxID=28031 RepID=UPI0038008250